MNINNDENEKKITDWDDGILGQSEEHASLVMLAAEDELAIDAAVGLQSISLRMPIELLNDLKAIAKKSNLGYQPLIKQVLQRFVVSEMKKLLNDQAALEAGRAQLREELEHQQNPDDSLRHAS